VFGGAAWTWEPRRRQYYLHHFLSSQPRLNLRKPAVLDAVLAGGAFWLDRGVDGFRLDAIDFLLHDPQLRDNPPAAIAGAMPSRPFGLQRHVNDMLQPEIPEMLRRIRALTDRYPSTATLAEVSSQDGAFMRVHAYTAGMEQLHMAYTLRLLREPTSPSVLRRALAEAAARPADGAMCWSFANHDVERAVTRWRGSRDHAANFSRMLMALVVALGGSACIYQGEELGLPDAVLDLADLRDPFGIAFYPDFRGRDGSRTPMPWSPAAPHAGFTSAERPWLPVPDAHRGLAVEVQEKDAFSPLNTLRRLLRWRKTQPVLRHGSLLPLDLGEKLFGCERHLGGARILFACNFGNQPAALLLERNPSLVPLRGHGFPVEMIDGVVVLPPYGVFFATIDPE
jgi:alpha-glucosidase